LGHQINEDLRRIALVFVGAPELIEASATDDQSWIDFEAVRPEVGVLKKLNELGKVVERKKFRQKTCSMSRSKSTLGKFGIMWITTL
jgi:hypothetical protein